MNPFVYTLNQKSVASSATDDQQPAASRERGVGESSEFNSFQYWRDPIVSIDDDLLKLVVCVISNLPYKTFIFQLIRRKRMNL